MTMQIKRPTSLHLIFLRTFTLCFLGITNLLTAQNFIFSQPEKMDSTINSQAEESMPIVSPDGKTMFFVRTFYEGNLGGRYSGQDIWMSKRTSNGGWTEATNEIKPLNNQKNNAVVGISKDNNTVYLLDSYGPVSAKIRGIAKAYQNGDAWSQPFRLPIKGLEANNLFLGFSMSADEQVLLISMKAEGGFGEEDLYVCLKDEDGTWSAPQNLGPTINSSGFEISPFLSADKKTLFFASNGHPGFGDADIFMSKRLYDSWLVWSKPVNLGSKINSTAFEAYFHMVEESEAYFVSNRDNGLSDIYHVSISKESPEDRKATINPDKYKLSESEIQELLGLPISRTIYFDFNSSIVADPSKELIYFLANKLLDNPGYQLELIGHTDQEGTDDFNESLSVNRAKEVARLFEGFGISGNRISVTGFGKRRPIVESGTPEEKAKNRRVEIFFVK